MQIINAVLPSIRARLRGRIINVSLLATWIGEPNEASYAALKAALTRYVETLRLV